MGTCGAGRKQFRARRLSDLGEVSPGDPYLGLLPGSGLSPLTQKPS